MEYEERVVAFVDILGFESAIDSTIRADGSPDEERVQEIDDALWEMAKLMEPETRLSRVLTKTISPPSRIVTQFSDSIVGSLHASDPVEVFRWLESLYWVPIELMRIAGLTCRGGVAFGYCQHTESALFGPAINRAYRLEKDKANHPRIVIDPEVFSMLDGARTLIRNAGHLELEDVLSRAEDGWHYLNYFKSLSKTIDDKWGEYQRRLNQVVNEHLLCPDPRIREKYEWMNAQMHGTFRPS